MPLKIASKESLEGLADLVTDYRGTEVVILPWQTTGKRQVTPGKTPASILLGFSLTVKAATLIFISGRGSAISSAKQGKSGFIYNFVKS